MREARTLATITRSLRSAGLSFDSRRRLVSCRGRKEASLPYRYIGTDDCAGSNQTGQEAVDSY